MKKSIYILSALAFIFFLSSCQEEDELTKNAVQGELTFSSVIKDRTSISTRALGDDFFTQGGQIDVNITSSNPLVGQQSLIYTYGSDRIFRGNPGFHFSLNDDYLTEITAVWPTSAQRSSGFTTDQRDLEDYKSADWMKASHSITQEGVMPTDAPVPLTFVRENVMLDFELVGQNTKGLDIQSLLIELQTAGQSTAYWAYCGNPNGHAQLILEAGTAIFAPENYLIGRITVSNNDNYTIIFPQTNLVLEEGKRYLVTLTPQGYYMNAYVVIGGWNTVEDEGVGIPFQQPSPGINGNFTIENPVQLITMSYLIRHYDDSSTFDWSSRTYNISSGLVMTPELAAKYIPIHPDEFTGQILLNGEPISSLPYTDGEEQKTLQLFVNENIE